MNTVSDQRKQVTDQDILLPNGQGIGLEIIWSPVQTLPPHDKGDALVVQLDAVPNLKVEYINKGFFNDA